MNAVSSTHTIAASAACRGINHVLTREPWALAELSRHAGKTILVVLPIGKLCFEIEPTGVLRAVDDDEPQSRSRIYGKAKSGDECGYKTEMARPGIPGCQKRAGKG